MRTITLVAGAVFKESVRDRVPYSMVAFAVILIAASYLISQLTAGQDLKIIKDLGLAAISWFGLLIAIFIGIGLVSKEVERRSVFALLSKPLTRGQFILGKYAGLVFTLLVNLSAMTVFCWHQTALLTLAVPTSLLGAPVPGLTTAPDTAVWILARLAWLPLIALTLLALGRLTHRFEAPWTGIRGSRRALVALLAGAFACYAMAVI